MVLQLHMLYLSKFDLFQLSHMFSFARYFRKRYIYLLISDKSFCFCRYLISLILLWRLLRHVDVLPPNLKDLQFGRFLKNGLVLNFVGLIMPFLLNHFVTKVHYIVL